MTSSDPAVMIRDMVSNAPDFEVPKDAASADPVALAAERCRIPIKTLREVLREHQPPSYVLRPYIEANATTLMSGEPGTFKSFIALDWACRAAAGLPAVGQMHAEPPQRVLLIFAEGKGLQRRLSGWLRSQAKGSTDTNGVAAMVEKHLSLIERPINLSSEKTLAALVAELDARRFEPDLVVVDTLTRNSDGCVEESNSHAQKFLNQLDREIRGRYGSAVLLIHHLGKDPGKGARGPSSLVANTEAEIIVSHDDKDKRIVRVEFGRVKDTESPAPFALQGKIVPTRYLEGDKEITTLVMVQAELSVRGDGKRKIGGKNQKKLLDALETDRQQHGARAYTQTELRKLAEEAGLDTRRITEVIESLVEHKVLVYTEDLSCYQYISSPAEES